MLMLYAAFFARVFVAAVFGGTVGYGLALLYEYIRTRLAIRRAARALAQLDNANARTFGFGLAAV